MDIYYAIGQQKQAPVPAVEIISMLERGEITGSTMGWHRGCDAWMPLNQLPALNEFFNPKYSNLEEYRMSGEEDENAEQSGEFQPSQQRQFREVDEAPQARRIELPPPSFRFIARTIDLLIYLLIYVAILRLSFSDFQISFFNALAWLPVVLLEAICLYFWGTTPGKAMMGLRVVMMEGGNLTFKRMLLRSFFVLFFGMGLVSTVFTPVLMALSWWWTKKNMISPWDQRLHTLVETRQAVSPFRIVAMLFLAFFLIEGAGILLSPWEAAITAAAHETFANINQSR